MIREKNLPWHKVKAGAVLAAPRHSGPWACRDGKADSVTDRFETTRQVLPDIPSGRVVRADDPVP